MMNTFHTPVFRKEAIDFLNIKDKGIYVDATLGGGGHLSAMLEVTNDITVIAFDTDREAIEYAKLKLKRFEDKIIFVNKNFSYLTSALVLNYIDKIDGILFDLGVSSHQITTKERGFSFSQDARLDMRMGRNGNLSAYEVVNFYSEKEIARVICEYGEERYWRKITRKILESRSKKPIETTFELRDLITEVVPKNFSIKSVARVFQAVRIEVNKELDSLQKALESVVPILRKGGRIVVISYHSLEDRIVKNFFKYENLKCVCPPKFPKCICNKEQRLKIITKHPNRPSAEEIERNPKARSAKLRVAERC